MILVFRYVTTWWRARRQPPLGPLDESVLPLIVLPNDLDINLHLNNGRYLSLMDLGRVDLMTRCGLTTHIIQQRWMPLVGAATMRYTRSLALFQRYTLHTRIVGWDDKWFFVEQRFMRDGQLIASGRVRGLLRGRNGNIKTRTILEALGHDPVSPPLPENIDAWQRSLERDSSG
ncbi:MAG: thioesterase family protein [Gammaproteobacteria bacterium]|nr:thioesterase family protein [Gammaproteobacteria bacterium]